MNQRTRHWWKRILGIAMAAEAACGGGRARDFEFFEPLRPPRPLQVMAQRGEAAQAPANTRPALVRCVEDGIEWAAVDVFCTRDGQHALAREERLSDGTNEARPVAERMLAELKDLDVGSGFARRYTGERVLSLRECFELAKGKLNLCLEAKAAQPEQLAGEILAAGMERQVLVCDTPDRLARMRAVAGDKLALMARWHPALGPAQWALSNRLDAVEIDADTITPEIRRSFHGLGIRVEVRCLGGWDRPDSWEQAVAAGADFARTELPEEVVAHSLWRRVKARPVRFSLHRGANRYAPENTLPAFEKALRLGADFIEFDVRSTIDGKYYLLHDRTLEGTTDGRGPIAQTPSQVVATLSAGIRFGRPFGDLRLPTLDDTLGAMAGRVDLYFDAKAIAPEALATALARHGVLERTVVYGGPEFLAALRTVDPRIRLLAPLRSPTAVEALARDLQPYAFDADWGILSREFIVRCHGLGIRVFSDALGDHERVEDYLRAMEWGVDVIQTDHPLRLLRAIELWEAKRVERAEGTPGIERGIETSPARPRTARTGLTPPGAAG